VTTLEEVSAWSNDELDAQIHSLLEPGWTFNVRPEDGWWYGIVADAEGGQEWADSQADVRLLLLNAYGWLYTHRQQPKDPLWRRRQELDPRVVRGQVSLCGVTVPDPEDLDPNEVRAVYGAQSRTQEK